MVPPRPPVGLGEIEQRGGYTIEQLAEDVQVVMRAVEVTPAALVGHSMGGIVAQQLALSHPEALTALVLVATTAADPERKLISRRILAETPSSGFEVAFLRRLPGWFVPESHPELVEWAKSEMLQTPDPVALSLVRDYAEVDFRARLPDVRVPTLVIAAAGDASAPPVSSQEIARLVPDAKLLLVEGAGRFVQLERPEEVNWALREFLSNLAY